MKWNLASERLPENLKPIKIRFDGEEHSSKWDEKEKAFMVVGIRFPPTMYFIEWLDSLVPDKVEVAAKEIIKLVDKLLPKSDAWEESRLNEIKNIAESWQSTQQSDAVEFAKQ